MTKHTVVSHEKWIESRKALIEEEKKFTRLRDELARKRMELPWEKVEKTYEFDLPSGKASLCDLFDGKSQLIVYHFMFDPDWTEGCKSCTLIGDHMNPVQIHLNYRDVNLIAVSRAPIEVLEQYKKRFGWTLKWASALHSDFNYDFDVSYTQEQKKKNEITYNHQKQAYFSSEGPGITVFFKDTDGTIYRTYSCYARGLEDFLTIYRFLDIVPKGRDEEDLAYGMEWVRQRDKYGDDTVVDQWKELKVSSKAGK